MMTRHPIGAVLAVVLMLTGCSGSSDGAFDDAIDGSDQAGAPIGNLTNLSDFCIAMASISDDRPIAEEYARIVDLAPPEISGDFRAVIALLQAGGFDEPATTLAGAAGTTTGGTADPVTTATTTPVTTTTEPDLATTTTTSIDPDTTTAETGPGTTDFDEEGYAPETDPSLRLSSYLERECRGTSNNPGPPATQPLSPIVTTTDD